MAAKKLKIKTKAGKVVDYPISKVKGILSGVGFTGKLLVNATNDVFKEAKKVTKGGIITATNFEKSIIKSVTHANKIAMNTVQKTARKLLK